QVAGGGEDNAVGGHQLDVLRGLQGEAGGALEQDAARREHRLIAVRIVDGNAVGLVVEYHLVAAGRADSDDFLLVLKRDGEVVGRRPAFLVVLFGGRVGRGTGAAVEASQHHRLLRVVVEKPEN